MFKILIVSHGNLAEAMLNSAEMICGAQEDVVAIGLQPEQSPEELGQIIADVCDRWSRDDVMVFTDLFSGTPSNVVARVLDGKGFQHISGVNLALLIEALMCRDSMSALETAGELISMAGETIVDVNLILQES
jgi:mannose/fructose/sorbose-specific phosphotransferase system IIA component